MATWQDGPEYAPTARPDAFVEPDAAPLAPEAAPERASDVAPGTPPPDYRQGPDVVPLDRLAPPLPPQRDPREAFAVEASVMTSVASVAPQAPAEQQWAPPAGPPVSAWGSARAPQAARPPQQQWVPQNPLQPPQAPPMNVPGPAPAWPPPQINPSGFPPPQAPGWYPQQQVVGPTPPGPVTLGQMVAAATPALVITLAVGGIVAPLALPLYLVASVLATRVWYRRATVRLAFNVGLAASLVLGALTAWLSLGSLDYYLLWDHANGWAQLACWVVGIVTLFVQGDALRRHDPMEPRL